MSDVVGQVIAQMASCGMPSLPANHPILDGAFKRFGPGRKAWYVLRELTLKSGRRVITGAFGINRGDDHGTIPVTIDAVAMTDEERAELQQKQRAQDKAEAAKREKAVRLAANRARDQWNKAAGIPVEHPYLVRKRVGAEGLRVSAAGLLLIPLVRGDQLVGLQKIDQQGEKRFNQDMDKKAAYHMLGTPASAKIIALGEGYATCMSSRMAAATTVDLPVAVAFDAGNIMSVAQSLRRDYPAAHLLFLADDDYLLAERLSERLREDFKISTPVQIDGTTHTVIADDGAEVAVMAVWRKDPQGIEYIEADARSGRRMSPNMKFRNAGVASCHAAAHAVGNASVVKPVFRDRAGRKLTDFNDLQIEEGIAEVEAQIGFSILAAKQPKSVSPAPSGAPAPAENSLSSPSSEGAAQSPQPPGAEQPPGRIADGAEASAMPDALLNAALEERIDEGAAVALADQAGAVAPPSEGGGEKAKKEKPKKEYGPEHWAQVEDVLDNFVLVYGEDMVWDVKHRMLMKISSMRTIVSNNDVMKFWGGPQRRWVFKHNIVFDPQEVPSQELSGPNATVNLFNGWKMKPKKGSHLKIQTLLSHLCDGNEDLMTWIERWLAYPMRNRGAKMETSIIMHGDEGSGKNFFFERVIKRIYGEYGYVIGNAQLESQFNDWASKKLFMVADEVVTRSELKHMKGKLKYLVSGDMIIINPKGLPEHGEANHMNFVFLSNELQPLALDKTDRRYLVIWTPPALTREFYVEVAQEIDAGGIEAYFHYLLHELDMGDFNEHTKPLYTAAKDDLIEKSLTPAERFYREWSRGFLPMPFITCGATQLYDAYKVWCEKSGESKYISQTLFSPTVLRYAGGDLEKHVVKYEYGEVVKQRNVFIQGVKPEGKTLSDWVTDASALFEKHLQDYRRRPVVNVDG